MVTINEAEVMDALHECYDPEIPVNIVDLGLVYGVNIDDERGHVDVTMTLTSLGCPMAGDRDARRRGRECSELQSGDDF